MQAKSCRFSVLGVIAIATAGLVRVPAKAQCCDLVDQKRAVTTWAYDLHCGGDASDSDLAVDFGLFDRTIHATVACALSTSDAAAGQQSEIGNSAMTAVGGSHLFCESWVPNPIFGAGSSIFEVTFDVWSPAAFALVGELTAAAEGDLSRTTAEVRISLTEFEGETLFTHTLNPGPGGTPNSLILAEMGLLTPGLHTLRAVTEGLVRLPENPHTGIADATFDFTFELAPPCPGDLDGDGDVDLADLAQLLANCGTTSGAAYEDGDLDCDGDVDLSDLAELLSRYGTICDWP